jgi:hypothetical protein
MLESSLPISFNPLSVFCMARAALMRGDRINARTRNYIRLGEVLGTLVKA